MPLLHSSLLLLPAPPIPASPAALITAYRPPLEMALAKTKDAAREVMLVIAVATTFDTGRKTLCWADAQVLLARLYTLLAVLCEKLDIEPDVHGGPGSVDARVVLLDGDGDGDSGDGHVSAFVGLPMFAATLHPWHRVYYVESEAGLRLRNAFLERVPAPQALRDDQLVAVAGGLTMRVNGGSTEASDRVSTTGCNGNGNDTPLYRVVCLGGTFDHLHVGHKLLLTAGALLLDMPSPLSSGPSAQSAQSELPHCEYVIGVTGDALLRNKQYAEYVQPWDERARNVLDVVGSVLVRNGCTDGTGVDAVADGDIRASFDNGAVRVQCVRIDNPYGPTIERADIGCLVLSGETRSGGQAVNKERAALGWAPLPTYEVDVLSTTETAAALAADDATGAGTGGVTQALDKDTPKISSTAIRKHKAELAGRGVAREQIL